MLSNREKVKRVMATASLFVALGVLPALATPSATTTYRNPLVPNANTASANQAATIPSGMQLIPGSGPSPTSVIQGDQTALPPVSNTSDKAQSNQTRPAAFKTQYGQNRTIIYLYRLPVASTMNPGGNAAGAGSRHMVQTIRPDQLSAQASSKILSILGVPTSGGPETIDVTVTDTQLAQIQAALFQYPATQQETLQNGVQGNQIVSDPATSAGTDGNLMPPATSIYPNTSSFFSFDTVQVNEGDANTPLWQSPLPTVRTFCRYLVILGVVAATVWMAFAATAVVMGHREGGARVVGTAAGLMLLLMGYTIWKIVQINSIPGYRGGDHAGSVNRTQEALVTTAEPNPNVPLNPPATVVGAQRTAGILVDPLSGK